MTNILDESKILTVITKTSIGAKILIIISLAIFFTVIWFFSLFLPSKIQLKKESEILKNLEKQILSYKKNLDAFSETLKENMLLSKEFNELVKENFNIRDLDLVLGGLKKNQFRCAQFAPIENRKNENYFSDYYLLSGKGEFEKFITFLKYIRNNCKKTKIDSLKIESKGRGRIDFISQVREIVFF